jgi:hypothetical protein
MENMARKS